MLFDKKCPSNVIFIFNDMHNGNMKLEHFIDIGKKRTKELPCGAIKCSEQARYY